MSDQTLPSELLDRLTDPQRIAVLHETGPLMVLAGPGSGKTRVVTTRLASLIFRGTDSRRIVALTFTNKAAEEMKARVDRMVGHHESWISTFHRFCSHMLRRHASLVGLEPNFSIYDTSDSKRTMRAVLDENNLSAARVQPRQLLRAISNAKNQLLTPEQFEAGATSNVDTVAAVAYPLYQQRLLRSNAVDFDDLLVHVANLLWDNPELRAELDEQFEYLLVDEYQDTNYAQYRIVQAVSQDRPNLTVTGDPDQSIYGWRGAHLNNVLDFERDFPAVRVVKLEQNFRSTGTIVHTADVLIANNVHRKPKALIATKPRGGPVMLHRFTTGQSEAAWIADHIAKSIRPGDAATLDDFAILYRTNATSRIIEHALMDRGIPYRVVNGVEFYQRKEIKDLLAYLNLINNPRDDAAFLRVVNEPSRGVGPKNLDRITQFATQNHFSLWEAACSPACLKTLSGRPRKTVKQFVDVMSQLMRPLDVSLGTFVSQVIEKTGYGESLTSSNTEQDENRLDNLRELVVSAGSFDIELQGEATLERFLEQKALVNETDNLTTGGDAVTLMTLHGAKGLEFPTIFLIAIEQGLLPHARALDEPLEEEEERRLFFVGITRAQECLHLSFADYRRRQEGLKRTVTSGFLNQLPKESVEFLMHEDEYGSFEQPEDHAGDDFHDGDHHLGGRPDDHEYSESLEPFDVAPATEPPANLKTGRAAPPAQLMTAASLLDDHDQRLESLDPESFQTDMLVTHPQHGHGKVLAVSGRGPKRIARVVFFSTATEHTFVLAHSPLQPMQA